MNPYKHALPRFLSRLAQGITSMLTPSSATARTDHSPVTTPVLKETMQFTTLFSCATSLALVSAASVQKRQFEGAVAVLKVFDYETTNCFEDEPTVSIGVGPLALDQCVNFSQGYTTVSYSYLESLEHSGKWQEHARI